MLVDIRVKEIKKEGIRKDAFFLFIIAAIC